MSRSWREEKQGEEDESRERDWKGRIFTSNIFSPEGSIPKSSPGFLAGNLSNILRSHIDNVLNTLPSSFRERYSHCFFFSHCFSLSLSWFFSYRYTSCWEKTQERRRKIFRWLFRTLLHSAPNGPREKGMGDGEGESFSLWHRHCAMVRRTGFYSLVFSDEHPLKGSRGIEISILEYCSRVEFYSARSRHLGDC